MSELDPFGGTLSVPPQLRASVERHQANLMRLVDSLRQAGLDEATIETSVNALVESYRLELVSAIRALTSAPGAPA